MWLSALWGGRRAKALPIVISRQHLLGVVSIVDDCGFDHGHGRW